MLRSDLQPGSSLFLLHQADLLISVFSVCFFIVFCCLYSLMMQCDRMILHLFSQLSLLLLIFASLLYKFPDLFHGKLKPVLWGIQEGI